MLLKYLKQGQDGLWCDGRADRCQIMQSFVDLFEAFDPCSKSSNDPLTEGFKELVWLDLYLRKMALITQ